MKQFKKIFSFELKGYLSNKVFMWTTAIFAIIITIVMFFPRISSFFKTDEDVPVTPDQKEVMLIGGEFAQSSQEIFSSVFPSYNVKVVEGGEEAVKSKVQGGEAECGFVINSPTQYTYYVDNLGMYDGNTQIADEAMITVYRMQAMIEGGLSEEEASKILSTTITHEVITLGKDQMQNFFYTYIMIFALYFVIVIYGQMVASNVATEKSSRAMELLITSAKPTAMMFGKVLASCLAGFIQLGVIFGCAVVFYQLNSSYWGGNMIIKSIFGMPPSLILYMLLFFVLGFLLYACLFGAVGSTVSKLEDINTVVTPMMLVFVFGFMVVMFSMASGSVDGILMKVCSYIPFTSPMAMFTRIAMGVVAPIEVVISIAILILSVIGIGYLSARIYTVGVLLYGNKPNLLKIVKTIFSNHSF